ncbi:MAG TPA: SIS domain-containing protein [Acidobacteriaceae bacterium]|nr:SIS domain-containing protein [Acidobacteriaceae bacterium]
MTKTVRPAFPHAMLREIYEQPRALADTIDHYAPPAGLAIEVFQRAAEAMRGRDRLVIAASGSSRHAGLAAEIMLEDLAGLVVDVEYASEYTYRSSQTVQDAAVLVISQSGETADTLAALREAKSRGLPVMAITNQSQSTMAMEADASLPAFAGVEQAIPATKSFTTQLAVLYSLALFLARLRGRMTQRAVEVHCQNLGRLPGQLESALDLWREQIAALAPQLGAARGFLYLGRGVHYPIAREGALKLKESAYLQAEGYPAGELKHGPNALVGASAPLVMIATRDLSDEGAMLRYSKIIQLMKEMRAQGATILSIATEGDEEAAALSSWCIRVPGTEDPLSTILEAVPMQLLAYQLAVETGVDMDRPRNLVKAVLEE